jgi:hypothetical protein
MDDLDLTSILVAGALGAVLLLAVDYAMSLPDETSPTATIVGAGFVVGAGVQVGLRLIGVS